MNTISDPVQPRSIGLRQSLWEQVDKAAAQDGLTRSSWIKSLVVERIENPVNECDHADLNKLDWGVVCSICNTRVK